MSAVKSMTASCAATSCLPEQRKDERVGLDEQELQRLNMLSHRNENRAICWTLFSDILREMVVLF